jgi:hypothetical protein
VLVLRVICACSHFHDVRHGGLRLEVLLGLLQRLALIVVGGNVVPIKYGPGLVAADRHRAMFIQAGPDHISHPGSA